MDAPSPHGLQLEIKAIGLGLKMIRKSRDLTQLEAVMAAKTRYPELKFTVSTLSNWERGKLGLMGAMWAYLRAQKADWSEWQAQTEQALKILQEGDRRDELSLQEWMEDMELRIQGDPTLRTQFEAMLERAGLGSGSKGAKSG